MQGGGAGATRSFALATFPKADGRDDACRTSGKRLTVPVFRVAEQARYGRGDVLVTLPAKDCTEPNAVCVDGQALAQNAQATIPGRPAAPIVATWRNAPEDHDGATKFSLQLDLDPGPKMVSYRWSAASIVSVEGGTITRVWRRVKRKNHRWGLDVVPSGNTPVILTVNGTTDCEAHQGVCTDDGGMLEGGATVTIAGPALLSVADAEVEEGPDAKLGFEVSLSRAVNEEVTVAYATSDGSATTGNDYTAASGTLTFAANETSKTVEVTVLDDAHDEGSETLTFTLSSPSPSRVKLGDATATGTITNDDPMPQAWITRFGRTVGSQVVDALTGRLEAGPGSHVTVGGIALGGATGTDEEGETGRTFRLPEWDGRTRLDQATRNMSMDEIVRGMPSPF